jgi:hypothetical protein
MPINFLSDLTAAGITSSNTTDTPDIIGNIPFIRRHDNGGDYLSSINNLETFILSKTDGGYGGGTKPSGTHNGFGVISLQTHTSNYYTQIGLDTNQNKLWLRSANGGSSYGSWSALASESYVTTAVSNLVSSAPAALDTLNELAAALGDDANFGTAVTDSIATKAPLASPSFTGNVGIGTTSPNVDLQIGEIYPAVGVPFGELSIGADNASIYVQGGGYGAVNTASLDLVGGYANVDVTNSIRIKGLRTSSGVGSNGSRLDFINMARGTEGDTLMSIVNSGKVGIGTTSPAQKLDVVGSIAISENIELGHATDTTITRVSAGKIAVEGKNVVTTDSVDTLTNKTLTAPTITGAGAIAGVFTGNLTGNVLGDLTGNAATATKAANINATANNTTNETTYITFVDGATGVQGIETDTDLTYNPSTNVLTAGTFAGALTGNVTGNVTGNAATATKIASITNDNIVQLGAAQTLTFKTLFKPAIQAYATFIGDTSGTTRLQASEVAGTTVLTLPAETGTLVTLAGAETLVGKTLTSPVINSPTGLVKGDVGLGSVDDTADSAKNVLSATKLTTAKTIGGVSFNGTANIDLPGVNAAGNQGTTGNAATATKLATAVNIGGVSFDGSANIPLRETTHHSANFIFAANTKQYIGLLRADSESTVVTNQFLPFLAPFNGKLLKVFVRSSSGLTGGNLTLRLEKNALGVSAGTTPPTIAATSAQTGPSNSAMTTYDWTSLSNTITAGDMIFISIESSTAFSNVKIYFTFLWEWDH